MIHSSPLRVKAAVREQHGATRTIPFAFRADPIALDGLGLNRTARAVFVLLLDNARSRGWRSRLSNGTLARILGCCEMTVGRALLALERAGLIARDYTHGGRVRTGIRVTWEALQQSCGTERACVQQECGTGSTAAREGFNIPVELTRAPHQSEEQTAPILSQDEDPEEAARFAQLGPAGYLRAMIEAGRKDARRASAPPPTSRIGDAPAKGRSEPDATPAKVAAVGRPPVPPSGPRLDDPRREVGRMLGDLAHGFTAGLPGRSAGRRRLTPAELARQVAEVRRKYAGRSSSGGG